MSSIYLVVPCYNEEEVLPDSAAKLLLVMENLIEGGTIKNNSRILFIDDGSKDATWNIILALCEKNQLYAGVRLSKNQGHQNALLAGLNVAAKHCDAAISIDADLQDDIDAIKEMILKFKEGFDVVYGVRSSREKDSFFKRSTAQTYYKLMKKLGANLVYNHADYRLMSRRALEGLFEFNEVNLFLRGIVPLVGYSSTSVYYSRKERLAGESKYPLKKMISFALDGITSFTVKPIRLVTMTGFLIFIFSLVALCVLLVQKLFGYTVEGWTTLMGSVWFLGGLQILCLGIIGEYIGKIYNEVKHRPKYIIDEIKLK